MYAGSSSIVCAGPATSQRSALLHIYQCKYHVLCRKRFPLQDILHNLTRGIPVEKSDLMSLCDVDDPSSSSGKFYTTLRLKLMRMEGTNAFALLTIKGDQRSFHEIFSTIIDVDTIEV